MRSSKSLKPNNLAKLRITPNRSEQFGEMLRRGKMDRRRQRLWQSAPDLRYNEASSEPYNSAKSPGKPLVTGAFCSNGVEKVPTKIVSNPSRDGGGSGGIRTHVPSRTTAFRVRLVTTTSIRFQKGICGEQDNPDARIALFQWRCHPDLNRGMKVLQTFALPLGYGTQ